MQMRVWRAPAGIQKEKEEGRSLLGYKSALEALLKQQHCTLQQEQSCWDCGVEFCFRVVLLLLGLGLRDCIFSHHMNSVSRERRESSATMSISVQHLPCNIYLRSFGGYSTKTRAACRSLSSDQTRRIKTGRRNYFRGKKKPKPHKTKNQTPTKPKTMLMH